MIVYQLMFPESGVIWCSQVCGLSLLPLVFSLILTVSSRLLHLLSKTMGCFSGCLMPSAGIQKLFCGIYLAFKCSFDEFVGEKVVFLSYSSAIFDYCDLNCCHLTACSVLLIYIPIVVLPRAPLRTYIVGFP